MKPWWPECDPQYKRFVNLTVSESEKKTEEFIFKRCEIVAIVV